MSRIYEALQRAELEGKDILNPQPEQTDEYTFIEGVSEPLPTKAFLDLDDITQHQWKPSVLSLPTLTEGGECVEQFRSLRSQIYMLGLETKMKTILVSSGMPAEGKTFVAVNLAMSLARNSDHRVLLIDGDLRRPSVHKLLDAPNSPGLADYLAGNATPTAILQRDSTPMMNQNRAARAIANITFIPAGNCQDNAPEIAGSHLVEDLIASLSPHFGWIIIDSPPALAVTDAVDLARAADAVLLVARGAITPYATAQRAQAAFSKSRILGFVLNAVKDPPRSKYYYNYYGDPETGREYMRRKD
ncbi:MAG: CpsD/CapB family tyrosine-protein kinase [Terracidiphilus sp.]